MLTCERKQILSDNLDTVMPEARPGCHNGYSMVFVNAYYTSYLTTIYEKMPWLATSSYCEQHQALQDGLFGDSDFYSCGITQAGWTATDLIVNAEQLQKAWSAEHALNSGGIETAVEQIRLIRPDVLYIQDMYIANSAFIDAVSPFVKLVVGQIASPFSAKIPLNKYDVVFTSFPHYVERFRQRGVAAYYQPLAFEPRVLDAVRCLPLRARPIDCSFVGGVSGLHKAGTGLLEILVEKTPIRIWGYGAATLPEDSAIRQRHQGEAWGKDMFSVLASSRITLNRHIDVAENYANNMRLFEATGCGALLITDYKDNLHELFEIGKEVVVYRSAEECAELINYYLAYPEEAEAIARAGQERTLSEHTYSLRMAFTSRILELHLRHRQEKGKYPVPPRVSSDYRVFSEKDDAATLAASWKAPSIPARQRAIVQLELARMYAGEIPDPYFALADMLKPFAMNGTKVLEIGCASGYYYEVLEYLLSKHLEYTGVDYSDAMIGMARDYYPEAVFFSADAKSLFFADRQFDVVISSCVLLHLSNYMEHLDESLRVTDQIIVLHRTPVCRLSPTRKMVKQAYGVETIEFCFNESELLSRVIGRNFELLDAREISANPGHDEYCLSYLLRRIS